MQRRPILQLSLLLAGALILLSCSGSQGDIPVLPDSGVSGSSVLNDTSGSNHYLWGYYEIIYDPGTESAELIPQRQTSGHLNILKFLEKGSCSNCVKITAITPNPSGSITFSLQITHPFNAPALTGFDVRGIAIFNGSHYFPVSNITTSNCELGEGELLNADGFTSLYNKNTLGAGSGGLEGYQQGNFSTVSMPTSNLNGFKRCRTDDPSNTRNGFYAGDSVTRDFEIKLPTVGFTFGYAIDANWAPPTTSPVTDPMTNFPPKANCPEPWKIVVNKSNLGPGLTEVGGKALLTIDIYDHQGYQSHATPLVECNDLFSGSIATEFVQDFGDYSRWEAVIENSKHASAGKHKVLVFVVDSEDFSSPAWLNLISYYIKSVTVQAVPSQNGWARTWDGGEGKTSQGNAVITDDLGNIYIAGFIEGLCDLDPAPGEDYFLTTGYDCFLSKFSPDGGYLWGLVWGGWGSDQIWEIDTGSGVVCVTGTFANTVDFDPSDGTDIHTAVASQDSFISLFSENGDFLWAKTWGGPGNEYAADLSVSSTGFIYSAGTFSESIVDFDPGAGFDPKSSAGDRDCYLNKFGVDGSYKWTVTWGGLEFDQALALTIDSDENIYITGEFSGTSDFDPSSSYLPAISNGEYDAFLTKIQSNGNHSWVRTWGGPNLDRGIDTIFDNSSLIYVLGEFDFTADFDTGSGVLELTPVGDVDAYLSQFNTNGDFQNAWSWGGDQHDGAEGLAVDGNTVLIAGATNSTLIDFDHTASEDIHSTIGFNDFYVKKMSSDGLHIWADIWGGNLDDEAIGISTNVFGNYIVTGYFSKFVDFDPGVSSEVHSTSGNGVFLMKILTDGGW